MKVINNKKGSAMLWTVLLTVILTILLGSILTASYAYFNYTMYTVKRQQAYFTARSAISVLLEEFTSEEQVRENTDTTQTGSYGSGSSYTTGIINFDGNYIDSNGNVLDSKGNVIYPASKIDSEGKLTEKVNGVRAGTLVRSAVRNSGEYKSSNISILPGAPGEQNAIEVSDFGFDEKMGTASAKIVRNEDDEVNISVVAKYADQDYEMNATVVRQPLYFGGIAVKELTLNGNLTLGENTDLYWNNTDLFDPSSGSINKGAYHLTVQGNLVTKGDARIPAGTVVAGRKFYGTASFQNDGLHSKKIWSPSEYIISNKTLTVGDTGTEYSTNFINSLKNITSTKYVYCNSRGEQKFGGYLDMDRNGNLYKFFDTIGLGNLFDGIADDKFALKNSENDALAIQYIDILSFSTSVQNRLDEWKADKGPITQWLAEGILKAYEEYIQTYTYDTLDVSYIDYSSTDEMNRSDDVVPLTYLFVRGGSRHGLTVRVRYGADPGNRTQMGQAIENISDQVGGFFQEIFKIKNKPSYIIMYLEEGGTVHLGYDDDGGRRLQNGQKDLIFLYSIYGGDNTTVVLHDGVIVVGEIVCDNLKIEGNAQVIYSSTSGAQVAKQKIAEYWAVSNYSD